MDTAPSGRRPHLAAAPTVSTADDFFRLSGFLDADDLPHTPLLVFTQPAPNTVRVVIVRKATDTLTYPDETPIMCQWSGEWRSDFFQFTVRELRAALKARDETLITQLCAAESIVELQGPRGGFHSLSWHGPAGSCSTGSKQRVVFQEVMAQLAWHVKDMRALDKRKAYAIDRHAAQGDGAGGPGATGRTLGRRGEGA